MSREDYRPFVPAPGKSRIAGETPREHAAARLESPRARELFDTWAKLGEAPYKGVTTDGRVQSGLFSLQPSGAPAEAMTAAAAALIGLLSLLVTLVAVGKVDEPNRVNTRSILGAFAVTGAIMLHLACFGLLIDLIRDRRLDLGRGQFNLIFVLWLTTAAALLLFWF